MYSLIEVPYHMGLESVAAGKGPATLLNAGADRILAHRGMPAEVTHVRPLDLRGRGIDLIVDVNRVLRSSIQEAVAQETVPVVLAGNCNAAIGILAGLDTSALGIVWLDKHADFHIPATGRGVSLEAMSLAIAAGHCHAEFRERIGLSRPVAEHNIVLAGFWEIEPQERRRLEESWISVHPADSLGLLPVALDQLRERVSAVYLHVDTDVATGRLAQPEHLVGLVRASLPIAAAAFTNYDPDLDPEGEWREAALRLIKALAPQPD